MKKAIVFIVCAVQFISCQNPQQTQHQDIPNNSITKQSTVVDTIANQMFFEQKLVSLFNNCLAMPSNKAFRELYPEKVDSTLHQIVNKQIVRWRGHIVSIAFNKDRSILTTIECMTNQNGGITTRLIVGESYYNEQQSAKNVDVSSLAYDEFRSKQNSNHTSTSNKHSNRLVVKGDKDYDKILAIQEGSYVEVTGTINDYADKLYTIPSENAPLGRSHPKHDIDLLITLDSIDVVENKQ